MGAKIVVLQQAAYAFVCFPDIVQESDAVCSFACPVAAGHSMDARMG
jgi:hypothetical protein